MIRTDCGGRIDSRADYDFLAIHRLTAYIRDFGIRLIPGTNLQTSQRVKAFSGDGRCQFRGFRPRLLHGFPVIILGFNQPQLITANCDNIASLRHDGLVSAQMLEEWQFII